MIKHTTVKGKCGVLGPKDRDLVELKRENTKNTVRSEIVILGINVLTLE